MDDETKKAWLVSNERFSPENLQKPPDISKDDVVYSKQQQQQEAKGESKTNANKEQQLDMQQDTDVPHTGF